MPPAMSPTFPIAVVLTHDNARDRLKKSAAAFVECDGDNIRRIIIHNPPKFRTASRDMGA